MSLIHSFELIQLPTLSIQPFTHCNINKQCLQQSLQTCLIFKTSCSSNVASFGRNLKTSANKKTSQTNRSLIYPQNHLTAQKAAQFHLCIFILGRKQSKCSFKYMKMAWYVSIEQAITKRNVKSKRRKKTGCISGTLCSLYPLNGQ